MNRTPQRWSAPPCRRHIPPMSQNEFDLAYRAVLARDGTGIKEGDVEASWRTYAANPAGHWLHGATR